MLLVIIHSMHVQQCRAMQIGVCMHTIDFHTLQFMHARLLRQALGRDVHYFLCAPATPVLCPPFHTITGCACLHYILESVSKPGVMLTVVRGGWASARSDQQIHRRSANCDAYHPHWLVASPCSMYVMWQ